MYLVDTNVICEPTRAKPSTAVLEWLKRQSAIELSAISMVEMEFGVARLPKGDKRDRLTTWLEGLLATPGVTVVDVDVAIARAAGRLRKLAESSGRQPPEFDLIIAATAQVKGSVIATRNVADFEGLGVALLNPFDG